MTARPSRSISLAVVGCGYWGQKLVRNLRALPAADVVALCDPDEAALAPLVGRHPHVRTERDFSRLLMAPGIDAVVIATPLRHHHAQAKASLLAGKHTFVEKPLAASAAQCRELVALAERAGLTLMVGHTYLYAPALHAIAAAAHRGDFGDILSLTARRLNLGRFQTDANVTWDLAPHDLAIILHLLDERPISVNCQGHAHLTPGLQDVTTLSLRFASGRFASIQSSWLEPRKVREMTLVGTRRTVVFDDLVPRDQPPGRTVAPSLPRLDAEEPLRAECRHFLECIATRALPRTSGRDGLAIVHILEAATESLRRDGAPVSLAPAPPVPRPRNPFLRPTEALLP